MPDIESNLAHSGQSAATAGMVIRRREPVNFEYPFDRLDAFLTPSSLFYILSHFKAPTLETSSYQLKVDGAVATPMTFRYEDLRAMPSETRAATLECAGNSRIFLVPQVEGAQWQLGAVGNAEWTAEFLDAPLRFAWRRFQYAWQVPEQPTGCELMAGAQDSNGRKQPEKHHPSFGTYVIHHPIAIEVFIDSPKPDSDSSPAS